MTIIDPPVKSTENFYTNNKNFVYERRSPAVQSIEPDVITLTEKESVYTIDEEDPYSIKHTLSNRKKWFILSIVTLQGFLGPLTSSIYVPAIVDVRKSLNASFTAINATIALYVFVMGFAPLMWASLSERSGRRAVYTLSTLIYLLSTIGCALAKSVSAFIALRAFQSIGASAAQAVGAGTITDLFDVQERGNAMGLFLLGALIGPVLGPIAGGFINEFLDWRYIFWCLSGLGGLTFLLIVFFLPETSSLILQKRAEYNSPAPPPRHADDGFATTEKNYMHHEFITRKKPKRDSVLLPIKYLLKPSIVVSTTPYSIAYGFMYFVIASLPQQLVTRYGFSSYQVGLAYLANGIGNALGAYISGLLSDKALNRRQVNESEDKLEYLESRLLPMWLGVLFLPWGLLLYGWSVQFKIPIMSGLSGLFLLGLGVGIVQTPANTYIVDANQKHSASAMSTANLLRCISAGCTPLVAPALIGSIGNGWSTTILAIISLMSGLCIYFVHRYGKQWRHHNA